MKAAGNVKRTANLNSLLLDDLRFKCLFNYAFKILLSKRSLKMHPFSFFKQYLGLASFLSLLSLLYSPEAYSMDTDNLEKEQNKAALLRWLRMPPEEQPTIRPEFMQAPDPEYLENQRNEPELENVFLPIPPIIHVILPAPAKPHVNPMEEVD